MRRIDQTQFKEQVEQAKGTVLFAFMQHNCPVCRQMRPQLEQLEILHPKATFVEAAVEMSPQLVEDIGPVILAPLILIYRDGQRLHASEGMVSIGTLASNLKV